MDPGATARHWFGAPRSAAARLLARTNTRLGRNVLANYAGTAVSAAAPLLALPFLLRALGPALWGLVAFSTLLVSTLAVLNSGLAQSMIREFGTRWAAGAEGREASARLLFSYERIYWVAAAVIALAGPVADSAAQSTNGAWSLSEGLLRRQGFTDALLINDYAALALAAPHLTGADLATLGPELPADSRQTLAVVGAGTGFGVGALARDSRTGRQIAFIQCPDHDD